MKNGDLVEKVREDKFSNLDFKVGDFGVIIKGPYEKNMTDIEDFINPWKKSSPRIIELKKVVDILKDGRVYKYCVIENFRRIKR